MSREKCIKSTTYKILWCAIYLNTIYRTTPHLTNPPHNRNNQCMDTIELDDLDLNTPIKLSVPLVAMYLKKGYKQVKIANTCNVSRQAVNDYIKRHSEELEPLKSTHDDLMATMAQAVAAKAMGKLHDHLDLTSKKDLIALNAISGTHIEKYRLLSNQSTENIGVQAQVAESNKEIEAVDVELLELKKELKALKGK